MNTITFDTRRFPKSNASNRIRYFLRFQVYSAVVIRVLIATLSALFCLAASAWLIFSPGLTPIFLALLWGSGLIFMALAIDVSGSSTALCLVTGLALCTIAILSQSVNLYWAFAGAVLLTAWLAKFIAVGK